ncbi:single-stranded-DNA-specific exonuclease RecJ [Ignatzschineria ureiclastica]|uniref:Single-stranded-DNA-specific exonuclease RecJ n=1 Tax=Ignatzschineria ureiclastica TaxID=472582 RepID=A0A2U2AEC1_9GAMM|nr:single-stranded-DNA-specific exonuclease RecJ [Ignatzschineria ureiclastica]PWD81012.1 single-stranded-DNA-specific exonuclease RecJ [Ignatzschineria ureiclastica]GGZ93269.1 single-stranded-DNA-specific exonuclease [Ignatzschineria ureiclastica]
MKIIRRTAHHSYQRPEHSTLLQRVLANRAITEDSELDLSLKGLYPYHSLSNIEPATQLVVEAILAEKDILIVGDYDVDGATSIALAIRILRDFGVYNIRYTVPHRILDGYGLSRSLVQKILIDPPDLLITVDNGISNIDGVALARENGIDVVVTDHHLPPETLPNANAIVNPNLPGDQFPSKALAGVGVIFYLLLSVRAKLIEVGYFKGQAQGAIPNLGRYLDIVALGTVADLVPLDGNNRRMAQQGLLRMRQGMMVPGIAALIEVSQRNREKLSTSDIGFSIAPLLNAAGRLDDMQVGIELLLTDQYEEAFAIAQQLYALNEERKMIERGMRAEANDALEKVQLKRDEVPLAICLYNELWHQGITGIVASRIKEQYYRPTFIFAYDNEGLLKGSGRSIQGIHLRDVISNVARDNPGIINTFGGHAMAAGLSIYEEYLPQFTEAINAEMAKSLEALESADEILSQKIYTDGALALEEYRLDLVDEMKLAYPWGQQFPEPLFDDRFEVVDYRILKDLHLKFTLRKPGTHTLFEALAFFQAHQIVDNVTEIHCAFKLDINEWRGERKLQLLIDYFEAV